MNMNSLCFFMSDSSLEVSKLSYLVCLGDSSRFRLHHLPIAGILSQRLQIRKGRNLEGCCALLKTDSKRGQRLVPPSEEFQYPCFVKLRIHVIDSQQFGLFKECRSGFGCTRFDAIEGEHYPIRAIGLICSKMPLCFLRGPQVSAFCVARAIAQGGVAIAKF